jgi:hypothetical protein
MSFREMVSSMERQNIIDAVVEVVENLMREDAPKDFPQDQLEAALVLGRPGLIKTAEKIADKLLS